MSHLILVINLGSTTTKLALYRDLSCTYIKTYSHDKGIIKLDQKAQEEIRYQIIIDFLNESNTNASDIDLVSARGGLLKPIEGGTYLINDDMLLDLNTRRYGEHASNLSGILAHSFAKNHGIKAVITDPVVVDELCDEARLTGIKDVNRKSIFHALNQKAVARKFADSIDQTYEDLRLIVIHMGGGITVGAHLGGKVIDVNNGLKGDGPMSPTRAGSIPVDALLDYLEDTNISHADLISLVSKRSGLLSHLDSADVEEIVSSIKEGDRDKEQVVSAMVFQIAKEIGAKAAVLKGQVDQIIFTGGLSYSYYIIDSITEYVDFIAPITVYAGELEMDALAYGAYSVLEDNRLLKSYIREEEHD